MVSKVALFLAWRYLSGTAYERSVSTMVRICFIAILIGSFALTLVTAVMNGVEHAVTSKMQGILAQVIIRSGGNALDVPAISSVLHEEFPEVAAWAPTSVVHAIIQKNSDNASTSSPNVVMLRGIEPAAEQLVSAIGDKIITNDDMQPSLESVVQRNHILIGKKLAQHLNVQPGSTLEILFSDFETARKRKLHLDQASVVVGGIFDTGIEEFDSSLAMCHLSFLQQIFPNEGVTQLNLLLEANADEQAVIQDLHDRLGLNVFSWKDLYPALVSALKLEKYVMFFILALITVVASMNMISLLFMQITQKRPDIALLKTIGAADSLIIRIFMYMGMFITLIATSLGISGAALASFVLNAYPFISLPDAYYFSHLPATMDWPIAGAVFATVVGLAFIATWIPARKIRTIKAVDVLRFEG